MYRRIWQDMTKYQRVATLSGGYTDRVLEFDAKAGAVGPYPPLKDGMTRKVPIRIYYPEPFNGQSASPKLLAGIVYYHGGGFVLGNIKSVEHICVAFAQQMNRVVVSVDYRLAPEHKFPMGIMDCVAATEWVHANASSVGIDITDLIVAGDSAGGNIAAIIAVKLPSLIKLQMLIYPAIPSIGRHTPSILTNGNSPVLTVETVSWFKVQTYNTWQDLYHPLACPINLALHLYGCPKRADGSVINIYDDDFVMPLKLPKTIVLVCGYDLLLDEGTTYASLLSKSGTSVDVIHIEHAPHGFFGIDTFVGGRDAVRSACTSMKAALSR
jgi:acetyl esterase